MNKTLVEVPHSQNPVKGISLVLVMAIFVVLGIIAVAFITMSSTEVKVSKYTTDSKLAFHAAEAGLDFGISRLPQDVTAFPSPPDTWITLVNEAQYKSGPADSLPTPVTLAGTQYLVGYSVEQGADFYSFLYDLLTAGKMDKSTREIKARIRCGPIPGGTQY